MKKYGLESFSEGCIKCSLLQPEKDATKTLLGIKFAMESDHSVHKKTIKAFGGTVVGASSFASSDNTFFVVTGFQTPSKVNDAQRHSDLRSSLKNNDVGEIMI